MSKDRSKTSVGQAMSEPRGIVRLKAFRAEGAGEINVVVETPRRSRIKYKFNPSTGTFELHRALAMGFSYPFPFGFVPGTLGEDGDPLDILLITDLEPAVGTVVPAFLIGILEMEQTDPGADPVRNDRLLAVPTVHHQDREVDDILQLHRSEIDDLEDFFRWSGKRDGKKVEILARKGADKALSIVKKGET